MYILFSLAIVLYLYYIYLKHKNSDYWQKRNVQFIPKQNPFGAVIWEFITSNRSLAEIYKDIYDKFKDEPYVGLFLGSRPAILVRDPDNIQAILSTDFLSFNSRGIVTNPNDVLADNVLFIDDYNKWKLIRQKLTPVFTSSRLKNMFYIMEHTARDFAAFVKDNVGSDPFKLLYTYSTASVGASVFGIDTENKNSMNSPFLDMAWEVVSPTFVANLKFFIGNSFPTLFKVLNLKTFGVHEKFFVGAVKTVMRQREKEPSDQKHDFIDVCLELQRKGVMKDAATGFELEPSDELLSAQAFFFFIAGADTSANAMNFTLIELSRNMNILEKVHKEIDDVFEKCDEKLSYEDIDKLQYLDSVLNEALRKYPPIGVIQRKCTNNTVLPVGNLTLEKGVTVILPILGLHRDEKYYSEPDVFMPERSTQQNIGNTVKSTYLPFGGGNRVCIGTRFARLQVLAGLAWLLRRFTLQPVAGAGAAAPSFEPSFFSLRATDSRYYSIEARV